MGAPRPFGFGASLPFTISLLVAIEICAFWLLVLILFRLLLLLGPAAVVRSSVSTQHCPRAKPFGKEEEEILVCLSQSSVYLLPNVPSVVMS